MFLVNSNPNIIRKGLIERNAYRDEWKIAHYNEYRKQTDEIIKQIKQVDEVEVMEVDNELKDKK